jgi:DNA-binding transcriptional LysR family regulator
MDHLSFDELSMFARVTALGSLSAVARERDVPVSQVSRAMDRVERGCGVRLLRRSSQGLSLTHDGQAFLVFCQKVLAERQSMEADLSVHAQGVRGRTRLSVSGVVGHFWVLPSLPNLMRQYPELALDVLLHDQTVDLAREGIDIAVRTGDPSALSLVSRPLGHIATGLYASASYLQSHGRPVSVDDLNRHQLLSNCEHPVLNRWCFNNGQTRWVDGTLRSGSTAAIAQMAALGLGIAHLPVRVADMHSADGALQAILRDQFVSADIAVNAVFLPDRQRLPRVRVCIDHLLRLFV